ncbi:unnamed protein product [Danaus chrysippus]|uniref:(African queen) hypothetical protein n=1 Tax=Danaus chrysippus TaxID=151541 RepID=A0A8J2QF28_9NEOP|nr:unnamed protein product [Danaus chrysippus]
MAVTGLGRIFAFVLLFVHLNDAQFTVPEVIIQALRPKGIRIYIPDSPNVSLFVFQGNINKKIGENDVGTLSAEVTKPTDGKWLYENPSLDLKVGDVINYYVYVVSDKKGYLKDNLSFTVKALESPSSNPAADCRNTPSVVRNGKACAGQVLFEDNFDSLREDLWQIEQYIPDEPDFPFVSYQRPPNAPTVAVEGGYLKIEPKLQQDLPGYSNNSIYMGKLNLLNGCTAISSKCQIEAWGASIIPPIASGKLISKTFGFTYGVVEVRAKLPQGDWIYPDILIESLFKKYGVTNYASGVIRIAGALGNQQLSAGNVEMGNKVLYGGPIMDLKCRKSLLSKKNSNKPWGDDFHIYTLRWEPERITLFVDGEEWGRTEPAASGLRGKLGPNCDAPRAAATDLSPFDDYFFLTLGLTTGGVTEFDDEITSQGIPKPWRNSGRKASLRFWQDMSSWLPTWRQPALLVDYVRVTAL